MKLLIVDDDPDVIEALELSFSVSTPEVEVISAVAGKQALDLFRRESPDLVLLDLALPDIDGAEVLRILRQQSDTPVIVISAIDDENRKVRALELGADDYVTKPFGGRELAARVRAVLRRSQSLPAVSGAGKFECGNISVDYATHAVVVSENVVKLTPTEYKLLYQLTRGAGTVLLHDQLLTKIWGPEYVGEYDYLRIYVRRLREKLESDAQRPEYILTERGVGYRFREPQLAT